MLFSLDQVTSGYVMLGHFEQVS